MGRGDLSWSEEIGYLCRCGLSFRATRHRWVDSQAQRELRDRIVAQGPIEGVCPSCGTPARGRCSWVELFSREKKAVLVLGSHQRAELHDELIAHLQRATRYRGSMESWVLRPDWRFEEQVAAKATESAVPVPLGTEGWRPTPSMPDPASKDKHAFVCDLLLDSSGASVRLELGDDTRRLLSSAALRLQPCLLRLAHGYPVLSLRIIGSYLGQTVVIDAVADPGQSVSLEGFERLSEDFKVRLEIRDQENPEEQGLCREVSGAGHNRKLRFCVDSALEALNRPGLRNEPGLFEQSKRELLGMSGKERLGGAKKSLAPGSFQHLLMPEETRRALVELDVASQRENLRHLLEVDGLAVEEYEEIRQRVLASSLEQGLCSPSRFWPRIVKLGLAPDYTAYAQQLAENRQRIEISKSDDLSPEDARAARADILSLCQKKKISLPPLLEAYLKGESQPPQGGSPGSDSGPGQTGGTAEPAKEPEPQTAKESQTEQEEWDALSNIDLSFEANLLEEDECEFAQISQEIDDDMDRLFPRHGAQSGVEFMADAPTEEIVQDTPSRQGPPQPPAPPQPPPIKLPIPPKDS